MVGAAAVAPLGLLPADYRRHSQYRSPPPPGSRLRRLSEEPQERLWLARSTDGADSWEDLQELDRRRPDDSTAASGPGAVRLVAAGDELHLSWQAGHEAPSVPNTTSGRRTAVRRGRPPSGWRARRPVSAAAAYRTSHCLAMATSSICSAARRTTPTSTCGTMASGRQRSPNSRFLASPWRPAAGRLRPVVA